MSGLGAMPNAEAMAGAPTDDGLLMMLDGYGRQRGCLGR